MPTDPLIDIVKQQLRETTTSWSLGTFGAIAEFHRHADEQADVIVSSNRIEVVTALGGLRVDFSEGARLVPYETISKLPTAWGHGVIICMREEDTALEIHETMAELGADSDAMRSGDRSKILFDLGLGRSHVSCCVRTSDESLLAALRGNLGRALFDPGNPAVGAIKANNPERVFRSRMGRIEVYQAIPETMDESTPEGPHTHVLPDLLKHDRSHAANIPVPEGWLPVMAFYPINPVRDGLGDMRPFDLTAHNQFQDLVSKFADPEIVEAKTRAWDYLARATPPSRGQVPQSRHLRTAFRVALRQFGHTHGPSPLLDMWRQACDPTTEANDAGDEVP